MKAGALKSRQLLLLLQQPSMALSRSDRIVTVEDCGAAGSQKYRRLQPGVPGDLGELQRLVDMAQAADVRVDVEADGLPDELPSTVSVVAYRIVQESLTNVVRHSTATHATARNGTGSSCSSAAVGEMCASGLVRSADSISSASKDRTMPGCRNRRVVTTSASAPHGT